MSQAKQSLSAFIWMAAITLLPCISHAQDTSRLPMDETWDNHLEECEDLCGAVSSENETTDCMFSYGFTIAPMWTQVEQIPSQATYRQECENQGYLKDRWQACRTASFEIIKVQQRWAVKEKENPEAFDPNLEEALSDTYYSLIAACNWETLCHL